MNEKLKKTWDYIVSECVGGRSRSINVGGHIRRAAVIAAAEELDRNEEFCRWLTMNGWYWGPLTEAWHKGHDESNFEDVVKAWKAEKLRKEETE
jgi:hypothetical protein